MQPQRRAQEEVRAYIKSGGKGKVTVNFKAGTYRLKETLSYDKKDSAKGVKTFYRASNSNETVVFTGAISVSGWEKLIRRLYVAGLNQTAVSSFRQLYVNGDRMPRARTPDSPASFRPLFEKNIDGEWTAPGIQFIPNPILNPTIPDPFIWVNQKEIEAIIVIQWKMAICRIDSISPYIAPLAGLISMQEPAWSNANIFRDKKTGKPSIWSFWQVTRFENAIEFLDEDGEWYFDENSKNFFISRLGDWIYFLHQLNFHKSRHS